MSITPLHNMYHPVGLKTTTMYPVYFDMEDEDAYWINLVKKFGALRLPEERLKKYHSIEDGIKVKIAFTVSKPETFHEQLEARVQFLEWAKTYLPSEKYAELEAIEWPHED